MIDEETLRKALDGRLALVHTSLVGRVQSYDRATQTVTVRPVARFRRIEDGELITYRPPAISRVPVLFPSGDGGSITWPLAKGDVGILHFLERSHEEWKATAEDDVEPADTRRHALADAVFQPAGRSPASPLGADAADGSAMVLKADLIRLGSANANDWIPLVSKLVTRLNQMEATYNPHTHVYTQPAIPAAAAPTAPTTSTMATTVADDVRSTKIKGE